MLTNCLQVASLIYDFNHRKLARAGKCTHTLTNMPSFAGLNVQLCSTEILIPCPEFTHSFIRPLSNYGTLATYRALEI